MLACIGGSLFVALRIPEGKNKEIPQKGMYFGRKDGHARVDESKLGRWLPGLL